MGILHDHVKAEILTAMYASIDRMNHHIAEGELDSAESERYLQINLRSNFEELLNGE